MRDDPRDRASDVQVAVDGRTFAVHIVDAADGVDMPCGYVYEAEQLVMTINPFVGRNAPDWMVAEAVREALRWWERRVA